MYDTMVYELYLPFPPTINDYYVKTKRGLFISVKGRAFRTHTAEAIHQQIPGTLIETPMLVEIVLFPPDKRRRDIDNYNKALLDAVTHAGLWEDDSLIDQLFIYRGSSTPSKKAGMVYMRITTPAGPVIPVGMAETVLDSIK